MVDPEPASAPVVPLWLTVQMKVVPVWLLLKEIETGPEQMLCDEGDDWPTGGVLTVTKT
jgi:hypothetical protein